MQKWQNRRTVRRLVYSGPVVALLLVAVGLLARSLWLVYGQRRAVVVEQAAATARLAELEERHRQLAADIESLQTDRGLEERIRRQFPVARPGEQVIAVVEEPAAAGTDAAAEPEMSWWDRLRVWFNGRTRPSQG